MNKNLQQISGTSAELNSRIKNYTIGFLLSAFLTVIAYAAVSQQLLNGGALVAIIMVLAILQLIVQLLFFLHLGSESKPRWNLVSFMFMLLILTIIVAGSLWIMYNLNYNTMSPSQTDEFLKQDEGIHR